MTARSVHDRLEEALARIADPKGEGARACLTVYERTARLEADAADARARAGMTLGPLDGAVVSIKDLFDVAGEPTRAGSKILANASPASRDAPVVRRLRAAGSVIVAKTNMTEFAFSGIGANPHYGTPGNPADRARVPGGSSSGAAVAAADRLCDIAIGTDTGGSTRIPAAVCGIVGYKPSRQRVPTEGAFPLSFMLDSIGPLARTVADCARADAVMAGEEPVSPEPASLGGLRLGVPQGLTLADLDATVAARFAAARKALGRAGVRLSEEPFDDLFDPMLRINAKGGFAPAEAYAIHRDRLAAHAADFDPNVRFRIERGSQLSAADYVAMRRERDALVRAMDTRLADLDGLVLPTTPIVAPLIAEVATRETFAAKNMLLLRNTSIVNFFDLCAISLPLPREGGLPVGLMLVGRNGRDHRLFRMAAAVERLLAG
ncbi:MAG TPA: amidase [Xanthobacteraceae bacterium]|jgi:aspartyl-tRNA(Asn)/glutamyl-tRNA(Gln) amidotransferase subunit A|nr:amidase [Xanthobacteraceae bacterium]